MSMLILSMCTTINGIKLRIKLRGIKLRIKLRGILSYVYAPYPYLNLISSLHHPAWSFWRRRQLRRRQWRWSAHWLGVQQQQQQCRPARLINVRPAGSALQSHLSHRHHLSLRQHQYIITIQSSRPSPSEQQSSSKASAKGNECKIMSVQVTLQPSLNFTPNGKSKYCPNIVLDDAAKMLPAFISLT